MALFIPMYTESKNPMLGYSFHLIIEIKVSYFLYCNTYCLFEFILSSRMLVKFGWKKKIDLPLFIVLRSYYNVRVVYKVSLMTLWTESIYLFFSFILFSFNLISVLLDSCVAHNCVISFTHITLLNNNWTKITYKRDLGHSHLRPNCARANLESPRCVKAWIWKNQKLNGQCHDSWDTKLASPFTIDTFKKAEIKVQKVMLVGL